ncbi:MAG: hypothetical protein A3F17_05610 [Gammaproteobacteria bacterium RIFCSPHIGHO2_12_FULL_41_15]|nr:MAG: hypothetical protein A3F17_05610 [Gammaproteobacteria bacterium RIFCSPHIGHO2_12_FULL_41_15]
MKINKAVITSLILSGAMLGIGSGIGAVYQGGGGSESCQTICNGLSVNHKTICLYGCSKKSCKKFSGTNHKICQRGYYKDRCYFTTNKSEKLLCKVL